MKEQTVQEVGGQLSDWDEEKVWFSSVRCKTSFVFQETVFWVDVKRVQSVLREKGKEVNFLYITYFRFVIKRKQEEVI